MNARRPPWLQVGSKPFSDLTLYKVTNTLRLLYECALKVHCRTSMARIDISQGGPMPDPDDERQGGGEAVSMGIELAVGVGLGLLIGTWLDRRYGWQPWGMLIGGMLGLAAGLYLVIKQGLRMNKD